MIHYLLRGQISNKLNIKPEFECYANKFKKETGISIYNFRDRLYEITKSLVTPSIINRSTMELDNNVKDKILSLPDEDIIIPLDDDDWINPAIQPEGEYIVWNYIHFDVNQPGYVKYQTGHVSYEDYNLNLDDFKVLDRKYFPSCSYAVSVKTVRYFENTPKELNRILFKHGAVPMVIYRLFHKKGIYIPQTKIEDYSCFLTHIGNYSVECNDIMGSIQRLIASDIKFNSWMDAPYLKLKEIYRNFWG